MRTWLAAALALATVASAHAAPLDQFDWRTQKGFEQAYRAGVQYGLDHGFAFSADPTCNSQTCAIEMKYMVDGEDYAFFLSLASAHGRGKAICVWRSDDHRTCANDYGNVWTLQQHVEYVDGHLKGGRQWQGSWPDEPSPVSNLIDAGFAAEVRTQKGFEQAYREGVQYGFEHGSAFHVDQKCNTEKCHIGMMYSIGEEQYEIYSWLGSAELRGNSICVQHDDDHSTCANDHGEVWTSQYVDGNWKTLRDWQNRRPVEPSPAANLIGGYHAGVDVGAWVVAALALLVFGGLSVIGWIEWLKTTHGVRLGDIKKRGVKAVVLAVRRNYAFRLVKADLEQALAYRDQYWRSEIEKLREQFADAPGAPIPSARLKDLIFLAHPDKHSGSRLAHETTQWLLSLRAKQKACA
jgi:hypothetical protein